MKFSAKTVMKTATFRDLSLGRHQGVLGENPLSGYLDSRERYSTHTMGNLAVYAAFTGVVVALALSLLNLYRVATRPEMDIDTSREALIEEGEVDGYGHGACAKGGGDMGTYEPAEEPPLSCRDNQGAVAAAEVPADRAAEDSGRECPLDEIYSEESEPQDQARLPSSTHADGQEKPQVSIQDADLATRKYKPLKISAVVAAAAPHSNTSSREEESQDTDGPQTETEKMRQLYSVLQQQRQSFRNKKDKEGKPVLL